MNALLPCYYFNPENAMNYPAAEPRGIRDCHSGSTSRRLVRSMTHRESFLVLLFEYKLIRKGSRQAGMTKKK